jgi:two-component system nitrate/nitrite response regulator NarL
MPEVAGKTIRLLLVDDHAMFREGVARMLEKEPDLAVVGQATSAAEALDQAARCGATIVLLDVDLGSDRALDFAARARTSGFHGRILVLTASMSDQEAVQLIQAGVSGIVHKQNPTEVLCAAIRQVSRGSLAGEGVSGPAFPNRGADADVRASDSDGTR